MAEIQTIEHLSDAQNFGQWIEKINEVVDAYNASIEITNSNNNTILLAQKNGQIGNTLITTSAKNSYNEYVNNGVYYVPAGKNDAPKENIATNLYVATDGTRITQFAVTIENEPYIYVRSKPVTGTFSGWGQLTTKELSDLTYLKLDGSDKYKEVVGDTTFTKVSTTTLNVFDTTTFGGLINIKHHNDILHIANDGQTTIFDASRSTPKVEFKIKEDGSVVDLNDVVRYHIFDDKIVTYNNDYYIQRNKNTFTSDINGEDKNPYYIQDDGIISLQKDGVDPRGRINENVIYMDNEEKYLILNDIAYTCKTFFRLDGDEIYMVDDDDNSTTEDITTPRYFIEDNPLDEIKRDIVEYTTKYYLHRDEKYPAGDYVIATNDFEGTDIVFYIKDGVYYTDEEYTNPVLYEVNGVLTSINENNILYYIRENKVTLRNVVYYIEDEIIYSTKTIQDENNNDVIVPIITFYIVDDFLVSPETPILYKQYNLDTITVNEDGSDLNPLYIQNNNDVTKDKAGNVIEFYLQPAFNTITKDKGGQIVLYYIKNDVVRSQIINFYIQEDNTITTDAEGLVIKYKKSGNNILQNTSPITINMKENVCNINGTAEYAQYVKNTALTHSYTSGVDYLAASGKAIFDLYNYTKKIYMPYEGGVFTGLVVHQDDIRIARNNRNVPCKVYSDDDLDVLCSSKLSVVANSDWCELYLDKLNESSFPNMPCIIGARTRTGVTPSSVGEPVYALGSIEFTDNQTIIRSRKINISNLNKTPTKFITDLNNRVVYYIQHDNTITEDYLGTIVVYYLIDNAIYSDVLGTEMVYRIKDYDILQPDLENDVVVYRITHIVEDKTDIAVILERDNNSGSSLRPSIDRFISLGTGAMRYSHIYSASGEISTSDKNMKTDIQPIDDKLLKNWENIEWKTFKFKDSVKEKGSNARIHSGLIAQDLEMMLGGVINLSDYGFFCVDSWDDIYDTQYITLPAKYDESGVMIEPEKKEQFTSLKKKAGHQLSLRYQEIQAIENAYLRKKIEELEERLAKLEKK